MDTSDFSKTLTLYNPFTLRPARAGGCTIFLYSSVIKHGGLERAVFISFPVRHGSRTSLQAQGTHAHVIGSYTTVRASLLVSAEWVLPLGVSPSALEDAWTPSMLWPGLILGGVVTSTELAVFQPTLSLERVDCEQLASVVLRTTTPISGRTVLISGEVNRRSTDSLVFDVHDVHLLSARSAVWAVLVAIFHRVMLILGIAGRPPRKSTRLCIELDPKSARLALRDDGYPYGYGWPQIVISPHVDGCTTLPLSSAENDGFTLQRAPLGGSILGVFTPPSASVKCYVW
ncbi:hypothetical protein AURDEDRAFT_170125 [Auricularia subglabra TFB-10046 SS5]|nr:hypothetical protein AURDEDRAFT_170125 [Auricularia subglabra TFB-10046 SS5]